MSKSSNRRLPSGTGLICCTCCWRRSGDEKLAICAYHAGMSNVRSWLSQENYSKDGKTLDKIPYSDTEWYYDKVSQAKQIYEELYS